MVSEAVEENTRTTNEMNNTAVSVSSIMVKAVPCKSIQWQALVLKLFLFKCSLLDDETMLTLLVM